MLLKFQGVVLDGNSLDLLHIIFSLVLSVLSNVVTITEETLVCTEMYISTILLTLLDTHRLRRFQCGLLVVVGLLRFTCVLVDVRVDTERTPGIAGDEEVPEPSLPLELVFNPDPEVSELYFRFLFHNVDPVGFEPHAPHLFSSLYLDRSFYTPGSTCLSYRPICLL